MTESSIYGQGHNAIRLCNCQWYRAEGSQWIEKVPSKVRVEASGWFRSAVRRSRDPGGPGVRSPAAEGSGGYLSGRFSTGFWPDFGIGGGREVSLSGAPKGSQDLPPRGPSSREGSRRRVAQCEAYCLESGMHTATLWAVGNEMGACSFDQWERVVTPAASPGAALALGMQNFLRRCCERRGQCSFIARNTCVAYTDERIDRTTQWLREVESRAL